MQRFDIAVLTDLRFAGGVATALVEQAKASAKAGYSTGVVNVWSVAGRPRQPIDRRVRRLLDNGLLMLADAHRPIEAALVIGLHPALFCHLPAWPIDVTGYRNLLLATQPPIDGHGQRLYDPHQLNDNAQEMLGADVTWAPVSPAVRSLLRRAAPALPMLNKDWTGVLNPDEWGTGRDGYIGNGVVVGRHGRPDPLKWPDTAVETLQAYPARRDLTVRILGDTPSLRALLGEYPANWEILPSGALSPEAFLKTIDHFVYFHHSRQVEGYGYAILEAMASGAVPLLPRTFEPQFDGAAVYAEPKTVAQTVAWLRESPRRYLEASEAAATLVRERFSANVHVRRLRELIDRPRASQAVVRQSRRRVMFLSSNGIGLGHLTRQLAIARRCGAGIEPVFVTMSQAVAVVRRFGFVCEYIPHYRYLDADPVRWNNMLARELADKVAFYGAAAVVFDGNVVYPGLAATLAGLPDCWRIWCRRGMWRRDAGVDLTADEARFDLVIEPGDVARAFDVGPTRKRSARVRRVEPIRLLDKSEQLPRAAARQELAIADDKTAVLVQLGAGNNRRCPDAEKAVLLHLSTARDLDVRLLKWPIADAQQALVAGIRPLETYPVARYLQAFDVTVSASGYNSFHDIVASGLPTAFLPNENPMMDDQLARARHAVMYGYGLMLREHDPYAVADTLDRLLNPGAWPRMRAAAAAVPVKNGAAEVARLLEELLHTVRTDRRHCDEVFDTVSAAAS